MDKGPDAFRTISEVADDLDIPQHVLRFWETRFTQIKPLKRGGGRRYYRPDDVDLLKGIRHLLYGEGYTIKGVQRILREEGVRFVQGAWHGGVTLPQRRPDDADEAEHGHLHGPLPDAAHAGERDYGKDYHPARTTEARPSEARQAEGLGDAPLEPADRPALRAPADEAPAHGYAGSMRTAAPPAATARGLAAMAADRVGPPKRSELARVPLFEREPPTAPSPGLSADDCHCLEVALAELSECRRILGLARRTDAGFEESTD